MNYYSLISEKFIIDRMNLLARIDDEQIKIDDRIKAELKDIIRDDCIVFSFAHWFNKKYDIDICRMAIINPELKKLIIESFRLTELCEFEIDSVIIFLRVKNDQLVFDYLKCVKEPTGIGFDYIEEPEYVTEEATLWTFEHERFVGYTKVLKKNEGTGGREAFFKSDEIDWQKLLKTINDYIITNMIQSNN